MAKHVDSLVAVRGVLAGRILSWEPARWINRAGTLAVTRAYPHKRGTPYAYTVLHVASGLRVVPPFLDEATARRGAYALDGLTILAPEGDHGTPVDWSLTRDELIAKYPGFLNEARKAMTIATGIDCGVKHD